MGGGREREEKIIVRAGSAGGKRSQVSVLLFGGLSFAHESVREVNAEHCMICLLIIMAAPLQLDGCPIV